MSSPRSPSPQPRKTRSSKRGARGRTTRAGAGGASWLVASSACSCRERPLRRVRAEGQLERSFSGTVGRELDELNTASGGRLLLGRTRSRRQDEVDRSLLRLRHRGHWIGAHDLANELHFEDTRTVGDATVPPRTSELSTAHRSVEYVDDDCPRRIVCLSDDIGCFDSRESVGTHRSADSACSCGRTARALSRALRASASTELRFVPSSRPATALRMAGWGSSSRRGRQTSHHDA